MNTKQVDKTHYEFNKYIHKRRWASMWHQLDEVLALQPETVLEIGPGPGVFKALMSLFGPKVETLDIDPELKPDHVAQGDDMPFEDNAFDVVCAFQMLEHVPYEKSIKIFEEMARVSRIGVVISLPDAATRWPIGFHVPRSGMKWFSIPKPKLKAPINKFNGEHYWEINKSGYPLNKILDDLEYSSSLIIKKTYRVNENPYHRFFVYNNKIK